MDNIEHEDAIRRDPRAAAEHIAHVEAECDRWQDQALTEQLRGAVDPETLERHRWALDAAVRFITENGGNPDVVKSLLVLAEWGQHE
jgi:hypothetical protein